MTNPNNVLGADEENVWHHFHTAFAYVESKAHLINGR